MLIGLSGKAGSGKSTVTRYLNDKGFGTRKFAGPLKAMIAALLEQQGVSPETTPDFIEGHLKEIPTDYLAGRSPRYAMQTLGTEWGRGLISQNFWVDAAMKQIVPGDGDIIFDDVRFPNEALAIRRAGGVVVNVVRPALDPVEAHSSEEALADFAFNYVIYNDSTMNKLYERIDTFLRWYAERMTAMYGSNQ